MQYLPNWLAGMAPPDWWPDNPRDYFVRDLNFVPLGASQQLVSSVMFSKTLHTLVFGGVASVFASDDQTAFWPLGQPLQTGSRKSCLLEVPSEQEAYSNIPVPLDNLFGWAGKPRLWPIPIPVHRGAAMQVTLLDLGGAATNTRLSFLCAVIEPPRRGTRTRRGV